MFLVALRGVVADSLKIPGFQIHWKPEKVAFSPDGKLAYVRSRCQDSASTGGGRTL
jgi:hypothetical protein